MLAGLGWLVGKGVESQQPGKGGAWAAPTPETRALDEARLADQKAELADTEHQITMKKARSKDPDAFDPTMQPLLDRQAELGNEIANLERGFMTIDRESQRGRGFMGLGGLPMDQDREGARGRGMMDGWGPSKEEFGPPMPAQIKPEVAPSATDEIFKLGQNADQAGQHLAALNTTVAPQISAGSLDAYVAKLQQAVALQAQLTGGAAGGAGTVSSGRSFHPAPAGRILT